MTARKVRVKTTLRKVYDYRDRTFMYLYRSSVQVRIPGLWWTITYCDDTSKEYAEQRARYVLRTILNA